MEHTSAGSGKRSTVDFITCMSIMECDIRGVLSRRTARKESNKCLVERKRNDTRLQRISERKSSERTDTRRSRIAALLFFVLIPCAARGESLWSPDFQGYLADGNRLEAGRTITVLIDTDVSLSYSASSSHSSDAGLDVSGGDFAGVLRFLPAVSADGDQSVEGEERHRISASIVARVVDRDPDGLYALEGRRSVELDGREQVITLTGSVYPGDIDRAGRIPLSRLVDSRLVFRGLLEPAQDVIAESDLARILSQAAGTEAAPGAEAAGPTAAADAAGFPATGAQDPGAGGEAYRLTEEKRRELFVRFIGRLIDALFR